MKLGSKRYSAYFFDTLEVEEWVLRTKRGGFGYLVLHVKGLTWVKLSNKHKDWGFAKNVPKYCRRKFALDSGCIPMSATKIGALSVLISELRKEAKIYGLDYVEDYSGEEEPDPAIRLKLSRAIAYRTKLRKAKKKGVSS